MFENIFEIIKPYEPQTIAWQEYFHRIPERSNEEFQTMEAIKAELQKHGNVVAFDMEAVAKEVASARSSNLVLLGAASPFVDIPQDKIEKAIEGLFGRKGPQVVEANIAAFRRGREMALQTK